MADRHGHFHSVVSGRARGVLPSVQRGLLRVLTVPYSMGVSARRLAYAAGAARRHGANVPVISVGNITVGGTGKTPMVAWVVNRLLQAGLTPAILTRGYKGASGRSDEADWLADATGAAVVVDPDRVAGAAEGERRGANVLVLDDGFQHIRLGRDLDIVCIDATCPFGHEALLPRGLLREPLTTLGRADVFVITRSDQVEPADVRRIRDRLGRLSPGAEMVAARHAPVAWVGPDGGRVAPEALADRPALAFCGLARPGAFYRTLADLGVDVRETLSFPDHAAYDEARIAEIRAAAKNAGAEVLVTTSKDAVKIPAGLERLHVLEVQMCIEPDEDARRLTDLLIHVAAGRQ